MPVSAFDDTAAGYQGLEDMANFPDRAALDDYRRLLRERSREQAEFIGPRLPAACRALEVGCGNGRLLIELALRGSIGGGTGLDLARSRVEFASAWAAEEGLSTVEFEVADALRHPLPEGRYGAAICITGAFAYFDAVRPGSAAALLERLSDALEVEGLLVLELYAFPTYRRLLEAAGDGLRVWSELPADDPWRFYLSELSIDDDVLTHRKTFVHRTSGAVDEGRRERLRLYSDSDLHDLLRRFGFEDVHVYGSWAAEPYEDQEIMVVTARNRAGGSAAGVPAGSG